MIHDRDAHADVLAILAAEGAPDRVVFHAFSGDAAMARTCVDAGYALSVPGVISFTNAPELRVAIAAVGPRDLLVETDAPFLTPHPYRGRRMPRTCCRTRCGRSRARPTPTSTSSPTWSGRPPLECSATPSGRLRSACNNFVFAVSYFVPVGGHGLTGTSHEGEGVSHPCDAHSRWAWVLPLAHSCWRGWPPSCPPTSSPGPGPARWCSSRWTGSRSSSGRPRPPSVVR